jgi:hypothetical protein
VAEWYSEQERLANIRRNQELLKDLDLVGHTKPPPSRRPDAASRTTRSKQKPRTPSKKLVPQRIQPRRTSNRLAGVEADSETLKRKYEVRPDQKKSESVHVPPYFAHTRLALSLYSYRRKLKQFERLKIEQGGLVMKSMI